MKVEPQSEHLWLKKLVGDWSFEGECMMGPGQPPIKNKGTQSNRMFGEVWLLGEGLGEMPDGGVGKMMFTFGYDTAKKRFVGTFFGSMMTNLWIYDGALEGNVLTMNADGPSFTDPTKTAKYQDLFEIVSDDHHTLSSQVLGDDGTWVRFMTAHYRRSN